jgi:hypothetical protein
VYGVQGAGVNVGVYEGIFMQDAVQANGEKEQYRKSSADSRS